MFVQLRLFLLKRRKLEIEMGNYGLLKGEEEDENLIERGEKWEKRSASFLCYHFAHLGCVG